MSSQTSLTKAFRLIGKVTIGHVRDANKEEGPQWVSAMYIAGQTVQIDVRTLSLTQGCWPVASILISPSSQRSMEW